MLSLGPRKSSALAAQSFSSSGTAKRLGRQTVGVVVPGSLASHPLSIAKVTFASCIINTRALRGKFQKISRSFT
jgi:hypothetical protein